MTLYSFIIHCAYQWKNGYGETVSYSNTISFTLTFRKHSLWMMNIKTIWANRQMKPLLWLATITTLLDLLHLWVQLSKLALKWPHLSCSHLPSTHCGTNIQMTVCCRPNYGPGHVRESSVTPRVLRSVSWANHIVSSRERKDCKVKNTSLKQHLRMLQ